MLFDVCGRRAGAVVEGRTRARRRARDAGEDAAARRAGEMIDDVVRGREPGEFGRCGRRE